ncbi:hypothetical protein P5673_006070 [Acropora cervicornis]|uniref:Uncharacterized protein n=1 Tax=Acropora cervicornis TaxID=6130 RepID=A0AAD9QX83_ACRCE|nr:hypothetical protein P5673_006070 [Acropora cervicornis]
MLSRPPSVVERNSRVAASNKHKSKQRNIHLKCVCQIVKLLMQEAAVYPCDRRVLQIASIHESDRKKRVLSRNKLVLTVLYVLTD